ncbi:hypothetical protein [uncultured Slackia sp.]|uniref:hypothetical protein n=1 Tax=uncultured Slackia sp. TaxID=665903 RepID=UPI0025E07B54|nr:hypothetical protein [uncultured Slackia sp.]
MKIHNGVQLSDVEYEELLTLAEAADSGEDVMLAAFMRLCPTGQEGAFDESIVAAYAALADLGFIEGVQEGGEFFFEDITPAGRSLTNPTFAANRGDESALFDEAVSFNESEAFDEPATFDEPIDVAAEDAQSDHERTAHAEPQPHFETEASEAYGENDDDSESLEEANEQTEASNNGASGSALAALFENPATKQAVIAGAVAGFVAGAIAAAIVCFVL